MAVYDLGKIGVTPTSVDNYYVGALDREDIFEVRIENDRALNLNLHNITPGQNATLQLYRDANGNGVWDQADQKAGPIASSGRPGNSDEAINYRGSAGTYFVRVYNYASSEARYNLDFSSTSTTAITSNYRASNLLPQEIEVGSLTSDRTFTSSISDSNTTNTYVFSLSGQLTGIDFRLSGLSNNADMRLIRDVNYNRIVDPGEVIAISTAGGISSETISKDLGSYTYYLQVYQYSGNTNYTLTMDHKFSNPYPPYPL
jgi:hypothetical protein